jgi:hypothetical protein
MSMFSVVSRSVPPTRYSSSCCVAAKMRRSAERGTLSMGGSCRTSVRSTQRARELLEQTGLVPQKLYSADYIAQFYDHASDAIVLAPAFAALVEPRAAVRLSQAHDDYAWCDLDEAVARLLWTSQRWAVRHIHAVIACGGEEAEYYALT